MKCLLLPQKRGLLVGAGLVATGVLILLGALVIPSAKLPNILIGDLALHDLTYPRAQAALESRAANLPPLVVTVGATSQTWSLTDLGISLNAKETLDALFGANLAGSWWQIAKNRLVSRFAPIRAQAILAVNDDTLATALEPFLAKINHGQVDASLEYKTGAWSVVPAAAGIGLETAVLQEAILAQVRQLKNDPIILTPSALSPKITTEQAEAVLPEVASLTATSLNLAAGSEIISLEPNQLALWLELTPPAKGGERVLLTANQVKIQAYVKTLAASLSQEAQDGRVAFSDGAVKITQESRDGRRLDEEQAISLIAAAVLDVGKRPVTLPLTITHPEISSANLQDLGLKELIGKATTSYVGSPDNRRHNIANGTKYLAGKLFKPGEEFSVVESLGAVDNTTGYLPELVIKENRTTPEYGGGLCQVSTTLFRAALNAGLKITERQNHSYRVSYYERVVGPGLDATIYLPSPDLKFLNDTPGWILIQGAVNNAKSEVTFELYGTNDGRRSVVGKPQVYDITNPPDPIYAETADLPAGETKQLEKPHQGAKTTVTYQVYRGEELLFEQTFRSTYKAWAARYLVGTGQAATSSSTPSPLPEPSATSTTPGPSPSATVTPTPEPSSSPSSSPSATST